MVEDVVTTGLSSREAICAIEEAAAGDRGGLADRSGGTVDLGVPFFPLVALNFPTYAPDEVPESLAATPPSSRHPRGMSRNPASGPAAAGGEHRPCGHHPQRAGGASRSVRAAQIVAGGGDGITAHLREDRRHIRDEDLARIQAATNCR
jgi:hypothetical protein